MILRAMVLAVVTMAGAGAAHAQVLDALDTAISQKPKPDLANFIPPEYPGPARRNSQEGEVTLATCVDATGKVTAAHVSKSSGFPILDDASLAWVKVARFLPAQSGGKPVDVCNYQFTYVWSLPDEPRGVKGPANDTSNYFSASELNPDERPSIRMQPPRPNYTPGALERKSEGAMEMSLCIAPTGRMVSITYHGDVFDRELMAATSLWYGMSTYQPGRKDGKAVGVCDFDVQYAWKLPQ